MALPIEGLRARAEAVLSDAEARAVISAPTGSGKSTQVPRWCAAHGRVLVVEPRRVACRSLGERVAELEGTRLGGRVGYVVRDDNRAAEDTRIVFATPGVVLRWMAAAREDPLSGFASVVIDELHERSLDVDLILALCVARYRGRLLAMSATLEGDRTADYLGGPHLAGEGRMFPVERRHVAGQTLLPDTQGLEARVMRALELAHEDPGDVLVFLPGKAEIAGVAGHLRGRSALEVVPLHGSLSLDEQRRAFRPAREGQRKVILATNVAETSVTVPGVGVVIDSGLVRRTRYHQGRGYLTLVPIALDSADQRAGRAGRTAPGVCYRLWSEAARLEAMTPPAVHRESLVPLVLGAAACGASAATLPFLDPPHDHALESAVAELEALGAIEGGGGRLSERGEKLFGLPLDAPLGRLLVEAQTRERAVLQDAIDLVSALAVGRPLFAGPPQADADEEDELRASGCDATATILAVRRGQARRHGLSAFALSEARRIAKRLRGAFGVPAAERDARVDKKALVMTALEADPRCAYVPRRRKRFIKWSNGGTEVELDTRSAVDPEAAEALVVLDSRALGLGLRDTRVLITCAAPAKKRWLAQAGLGRERLQRVGLERGRIVAHVQRVHAGQILSEEERTPTGQVAREAIADLFVRGRVLEGVAERASERLEAIALAHKLGSSPHGRELPDLDALPPSVEGGDPEERLQTFTAARLDALGVESGDDVALLSPGDLLPPELPQRLRDALDRDFPRTLELGPASYRVHYELSRRVVVLEERLGSKKQQKGKRKPPPLNWLPAFRGFAVHLLDRGRRTVLRER